MVSRRYDCWGVRIYDTEEEVLENFDDDGTVRASLMHTGPDFYFFVRRVEGLTFYTNKFLSKVVKFSKNGKISTKKYSSFKQNKSSFKQNKSNFQEKLLSLVSKWTKNKLYLALCVLVTEFTLVYGIFFCRLCPKTRQRESVFLVDLEISSLLSRK